MEFRGTWKENRFKKVKAYLWLGWLAFFVRNLWSRNHKSLWKLMSKSKSLIHVISVQLYSTKFRRKKKDGLCAGTDTERCLVEKNNRNWKTVQMWLSTSSFSWCRVRRFGGKWAACQIGAKSELSGDYSSALLTAGGAEWASIILERRVWFGPALLGTDQKLNNAPLATQNPALKWVHLCITYSNCVSIKGWQVHTNYPDNNKTIYA